MRQRIVDACCLINLYASGNALGILRGLEAEVFVPEVVKGESLFIRKEDDQDQAILVPEAIDLGEAFAQGLMHACRLENEVEAEHFVRYAAAIDDGEATCPAIAKCRNWVVASDDRKALRLAKAESVGTITTAEIVKAWADSCRATDEVVAGMIQRIERYARFRPRRGFPEFDWWERLSSPSGR